MLQSILSCTYSLKLFTLFIYLYLLKGNDPWSKLHGFLYQIPEATNNGKHAYGRYLWKFCLLLVICIMIIINIRCGRFDSILRSLQYLVTFWRPDLWMATKSTVLKLECSQATWTFIVYIFDGWYEKNWQNKAFACMWKLLCGVFLHFFFIPQMEYVYNEGSCS